MFSAEALFLPPFLPGKNLLLRFAFCIDCAVALDSCRTDTPLIDVSCTVSESPKNDFR